MPKSIVEVAGFPIGGNQAYIIADIGSNHKQDLMLAKESIDAAAEAGANAVKFQSIQVDKLYHNPSKSTRDFVSQLEFPESWHIELSDYAKKLDITFFSSPTYLMAIDLLEEINVPIYKIASAQIGTFPQIVEKIASLGKPTIISTGIANYSNLTQAIGIFERFNNTNYMILHCNSVYPAAPHIVNMPMMNVYKAMFNCLVGFSDHTNGNHIALSSVAQGAKIIEKHFTLSRELQTPDSTSFAATPEDFKSLVNSIREVEMSMTWTKPRTDILKEESEFKNSIIYRVRATKNIAKGDSLSSDNIDFIRYESGVDARTFAEAPSYKAATDITENSIIYEEQIEKHCTH